MTVTLSIIVPVYNCESFLSDCIRSIMAGTYRDFEILLIDDGSTDGTSALCDELQRRHRQIRVFHTSNQGLPQARNLGLNHATGRYIGFVDADDVVAPDMFESLVRAMTPDVQLAACGFLRCKRDSVHKLDDGLVLMYRITDQAGAAELILGRLAGPYVWNKLYIKSILDAHELRFRPDSQGAEDQYFNAAYLAHVSKAAWTERKLYAYITTDGSITQTFRESSTVSGTYTSLPRSWRFTAEVMEQILPSLAAWSRAKTAMFYQTVLRKLENPDRDYIREAVEYVRQHRMELLRYRWGKKYFLSAVILCVNYHLWAMLFRRKCKSDKGVRVT